MTAGAPAAPPAVDQLAVGGRLILLVGLALLQHLVRVTLTGDGDYAREDPEEVAFVPLIGERGRRDERAAA